VKFGHINVWLRRRSKTEASSLLPKFAWRRCQLTSKSKKPPSLFSKRKKSDVRMGLEMRIKEVEAYLKAGKSINQIMRLMGITTDKIVRDVIAQYPDLQAIATINGNRNRGEHANRKYPE
jgi:hypothetical protein